MLPVATLVAIPSWFVHGASTAPPVGAQLQQPPNVVLILTDDQRFDSLKVMASVQHHLVAKGMTLRRAFVTDPLCCPSRATILTGRFAHTTGVYTNAPPHGGWSVFRASESRTIAKALDDAGYRTGLIGKYINGYRGDTGSVPDGWDRFFAFSGPTGYYDYEMFDDNRGMLSFGSDPADYATDVVRRRAVSFIRGTPTDQPLFLLVAPFAPHGPFTPAPRHIGDFAGAPVHLNPAINEDVSDKPAYLRGRPIVANAVIAKRFRRQWATLLAVDGLVDKVMSALAETGRANNTLVIFTSDNGLANREHRWWAKEVPYEVSVRVPMVVRYPTVIPAGTVSRALVSNVDIAPTIADFTGAPLSAEGVSLAPVLTDETSSVRSSIVLEHVKLGTDAPTYCGVRTRSFTFARYATGEEELYDLRDDPWQLRNVAASRPNKATELRSLTRSLCRPVPPGFSW
jgi:N-acetylglucosamine-6-sulfatase